MRELHFYMCKNDKTLASSPVRHHYVRPLCCNLCHSYMRYVWSEAITTPEMQALADRGPVWNPGVESQTMAGDGEGRR